MACGNVHAAQVIYELGVGKPRQPWGSRVKSNPFLSLSRCTRTMARGLSWCAWPARVKRNRISMSKGAQKRQRGRTVARSTLCEQNETQKSVICGEHARSGTARNIDSERATLSIESKRTDTLRRAVREDDQRTMMLDDTERQGSQQSPTSTQPATVLAGPCRN